MKFNNSALSAYTKNVIHLTVINEEGNYKIDEVW